MSIDSDEELAGMKRVGRVVALAHRAVQNALRVGVTTVELDETAARVFERYGAQSAPQVVYGFPGTICVSVNEEAVHGIPGPRVLEAGDLVKIDVTAELDGYYADAAATHVLPPVSPVAQRLCACVEAAFWKAARIARAGSRLAGIGGTVEGEVHRHGFKVLRDLCGHGIGRGIHESPSVCNYYDASVKARLVRGLVIALEPIVSVSSAATRVAEDRWTIRSADRSLTAHFEHTIVITDGQPLVLTAA